MDKLKVVNDVSEMSHEAGPLVRIFPDPTSGAFTLELSFPGESTFITVEIFKMTEEKVLQAKLNSQWYINLDLSGSPLGVCFVRVIQGDVTGTVKLVKQ